MLVRRLEPLAGRPAVLIELRPAAYYGARAFTRQLGSHHVRFLDPSQSLRVTTDAPVSYLTEDRVFVLDRAIDLVIGEDETLGAPAHQISDETLRATVRYCRTRCADSPCRLNGRRKPSAPRLRCSCVRRGQWRGACAPTTSIPEAAGSGRNWDYRYCWLRDAYFTVQAMNQLGATQAMEAYLRYLDDVVASEAGAGLQPVYGITGERELAERIVETLGGLNGMGPVRVGNLAYRQRQFDVYGSVILAATQSFFDQRLEKPGDVAQFHRLEALGENAMRVFGEPDAGISEFRGIERAHTLSSAMSWAAGDLLARIATRLQLPDRSAYWRDKADNLKSQLLERAWRPALGSFSATLDGDVIDASLLLLPELRILEWRDSLFIGTLAMV